MNLIVIPFHDWRKSKNEGFRTRDVHFIKAFERNNGVDKILVINRPYTPLELILKNYKVKLNGELIHKRYGCSLIKVSKKIYVLNYNSRDIIGQAVLRHKWFIKKYGDRKLRQFIKEANDILNISTPTVLCQNVFAYKLLINLDSPKKIFDGWDNFTKFPDYAHIKSHVEEGYRSIANNVKTWLTNSKENINFFKNNFNVQQVILVKNGVNKDFSKNCTKIPKDMADIPKPIVGYGGKLSYLIDTDIVNFITRDNPKLSFVFVGGVLDKENYNKIIKRSNVYFLGDKKYDVYPCYVKNFDIGIIPYRIKDKQHGGDSIKAYEYLQAGLKVVGTKGNGLLDLSKYLYLADDKYQFSEFLNAELKLKASFKANEYSWESKAESILKLI